MGDDRTAAEVLGMLGDGVRGSIDEVGLGGGRPGEGAWKSDLVYFHGADEIEGVLFEGENDEAEGADERADVRGRFLLVVCAIGVLAAGEV